MAGRVARGDLTAIVDSRSPQPWLSKCCNWFPSVWRGLTGSSGVSILSFGYFANVPNEWISAHLFATLRDMVKRGAYSDRDDAKKRLSGIFDDIAHVSMYAPYCDAFVMDTPMAELVRQPTVALEQRYGVKVFSLRTWDALFTWLDEVEAGMTSRAQNRSRSRVSLIAGLIGVGR